MCTHVPFSKIQTHTLWPKNTNIQNFKMQQKSVSLLILGFPEHLELINFKNDPLHTQCLVPCLHTVQCALCSGLHWFPVQVVSASPVVNSGNCFHCIHRKFKHNHCTLLKSKTYIMYTTHTSLHLQLYNATMKHILCFAVCAILCWAGYSAVWR